MLSDLQKSLKAEIRRLRKQANQLERIFKKLGTNAVRKTRKARTGKKQPAE